MNNQVYSVDSIRNSIILFMAVGVFSIGVAKLVFKVEDISNKIDTLIQIPQWGTSH